MPTDKHYTNSITYRPTKPEPKPHGLYDGTVFVVWALGVLICVKALRQLNQTRLDK